MKPRAELNNSALIKFICYNNFVKIPVLIENNSRIDRYLLAKPALSLLIEAETKEFFETGGVYDGKK